MTCQSGLVKTPIVSRDTTNTDEELTQMNRKGGLTIFFSQVMLCSTTILFILFYFIAHTLTLIPLGRAHKSLEHTLKEKKKPLFTHMSFKKYQNTFVYTMSISDFHSHIFPQINTLDIPQTTLIWFFRKPGTYTKVVRTCAVKGSYGIKERSAYQILCLLEDHGICGGQTFNLLCIYVSFEKI
ncbi:hypothetical protein J3Q64DRAFT_1638161 [Phycomyces blakesleeanus]|uniref:Uncharacterized protein n=1 Tax=Phycomyces blakesleeanus TaxID=4837 RepID=A0ABR3B1U5_PHYBL